MRLSWRMNVENGLSVLGALNAMLLSRKQVEIDDTMHSGIFTILAILAPLMPASFTFAIVLRMAFKVSAFLTSSGGASHFSTNTCWDFVQAS
ncbi:unnamed protein product [Haemonchus placei]|uniref:ABC transmembrane type-1 domain-containing protein n=1 Tax=Haemonchus placei TaxID=6290 RepID=A0A0N4VS50_HAEPC|nr:unnamed protein product [Haemonchus placei]